MSAAAPTRGRSPPVVGAASFPPRYTVHKYWGKKPANVVAAYLQRYTDAGTTVLDPFSGSGIVLCEALIHRRPVIAADINPIANRIARMTAEAVDPTLLRCASERVLGSLADLRRVLYGLACAACGAPSERIATVFDGETSQHVTLDCPRCGVTVRGCPDGAVTSASELPPAGEHPDGDIVAGWQMQKLVRRGLGRWSELFTPRNLVAVAHLRRAVASERDGIVRRALEVSFTAHLAQATRMIADYRGDAGGPSWKLNSYWLPRRWQELNPFRYFANRVQKTARGAADMRASLKRSVREGVDYTLHQVSVEALPDRLRAGSVGYVFTDPPYGGEGIQYGELSSLWNLWSGEPATLTGEINANPYQQKSPAHYARRLAEAFAAVHQVLAPEGWMSLTFANKDSSVWEALLAACGHAGFDRRWVVPMSQSAANVTNKVTRGAPKTELVVTFRKRRAHRQPKPAVREFTLDRCAREEALALGVGGSAFRTSALYDRLLMRWMRHDDTDPSAPRPRFTLAQVTDLLAGSSDFVPVTEGTVTTPDGIWTLARP